MNPKIVTIFAVLYLSMFSAKGQESADAKTSMILNFAKELLIYKKEVQKLASEYTDHQFGLDNKRDSIFSNLIGVLRRSTKIRSTDPQLVVSPYNLLANTKGIRNFGITGNNNDIYIVRSGDQIVLYVKLEGEKIHSFFTISKGENDLSYFLVP